jgi:hypothetical protein
MHMDGAAVAYKSSTYRHSYKNLVACWMMGMNHLNNNTVQVIGSATWWSEFVGRLK